MTQEELNIVLEKHKKWLDEKEGGERANLRGANLSHADLSSANLIGANVSDLVDDFGSYVSLRLPNPAPYCSNACDDCIDARGWCREDWINCRGFAPNIGNINGEVSADDA